MKASRIVRHKMWARGQDTHSSISRVSFRQLCYESFRFHNVDCIRKEKHALSR